MSHGESGTNTANNGVLTEIFSSRAASQIIDFFIDHKEFDYSPSEIAEKTGLSFKTVFRELPNLEKYQIICKTRKIGKTNMYFLNSRLPAIAMLEKFAIEMSKFHSSLNKDSIVNDDDLSDSYVKNTEMKNEIK